MIKKRIITLLLILFSVSHIYSQDISLFVKENTFSYKYNELKLSETSKKEYLSKVLKTYSSSSLDLFHPIYLNNDSLIDFIYDGPIITNPDLDGNQVLFFENKKRGNYEIIGSSFGNLLEIKKNKISGSTLFLFLDEGCCLSTTFYLNFLWMIEKNDELTFTNSTPIEYDFESLYFPESKNDQEQYFKISQNNYNLRSAPFIQDDNIIDVYKKEDRGVVLSTFKSKDRIWWFVIMDDKGDLSRKCGWMSSRYLEVL
ncbi:hypothetical protein KMW28_25120 [Flammeovirga yaeyamensis]|uniref:SH3b domain-containing protein n=1 Tax=Flammeovirga yaeyamensis TaxID=367791 RepID=A0AAX1NB04_9BACT|nr:hypothetical protein [Flammeovirga yaeyamensis]MBB3699426.1 hypothetical protein [Flammeovirga yaeyamensis]NMF35316.1 hypothetical protein [Flammeovirga yaeyamensis]QWG04176.1 hypothetical protein KMW28_25120 [Flammeovirga yaeyamensis]